MPERPKLAVTPKVVKLDTDSINTTRARLARLPAAVHAVHENGKVLISARLSRFFDQVDDSLFELADKASSNQDQNTYFDSMREIRVQRRGIERAFILAIDEAFAALMLGENDSGSSSANQALTSNTLSLVSNEDLEEMVAVDSTVSRAAREYAEEIQHLSMRIDSLVPIRVTESNNPLGPQIVCSAFTSQVKGLDVDIKVKLVLFKLFDKVVVNELREVYDGVNRLLVDHDILPSLSTAPAGQGQQTTHGGRDSRSMQREVLGALKQLFGDKLVADASPHEQALAGNELIALLSLAQRVPVAQQPVTSYDDKLPSGDVRSLLGNLERQSGIRADIGRLDDEVINLVNMLFEFILQDKNLAAPMKTLISRLQIPIVKVALIDNDFFTKGGHAARRLLNEMATAALGWQGKESELGDSLYSKMESIVTHLLHNFESDVSIFNDLLADFSAFMESERRKSEQMERRTVDAEDGKAKAELARNTIALEVELRLVDRSIPKIADKLIKDAWSNVMFVIGLKHGLESREWRNALYTLDDLLWSVEPPETSDDRKKLIRLVPDLLKRLRAGFDTISFNPFEMSNLFKALEEIHLNCIRGKPLPAEIMAPMLKTPLAEPRPRAASAVVAPEIPSVQKETIEAESLPGDSLYMQQVQNFVQGAWFEMKIDKAEMDRCRLAAYIRPTGKYIFVNRNGMKVAEKTQQELAQALKKGLIRPLDNSMLFDRALETVVSSLRKSPNTN